MIHESKKLDDNNVYWTAAIHTNTDNVHIHFQLCEYEKRERAKDMIEVRAFDKMKSRIVNQIIGSERTRELTKIQRDILLPAFRDSLYAGNVREQITELALHLPDRNTWQYNHKTMHGYRKEIDRCINSIIYHNPALSAQFQHYTARIEEQTEYLRGLYGSGNRRIYLSYKSNRIRDFYERAGNSLLKEIQENSIRELALQSRITNLPEDAAHHSFPEQSRREPPAYPSEEKIACVLPDEFSSNSDAAFQEQFDTDTSMDSYAGFPEQPDCDNFDAYPSEEKTVDVPWDAPLPDLDEDTFSLLESQEDYAQATMEIQAYLSDKRMDESYVINESSEQDDNNVDQDPFSVIPEQSALNQHQNAYPSEEKNALFNRDFLQELSEQSLEKAEEYLQKASDLKHDRAAYVLSQVFIKQNRFEEAEQLLMHAAEKDNEYAQYALGKLYLTPEKLDIDKAEQFFLKAAEHDNEYAHYALGRMYFSLDSKKDLEKAENYFLQAAAKGNQYAQVGLGLLYHQTGDNKLAQEWLREAAQQGNELAKELLKPRYNNRLAQRVRPAKMSFNKAHITMMKKAEAELARHIKQLEMEFERENNPELAQQRSM